MIQNSFLQIKNWKVCGFVMWHNLEKFEEYEYFSKPLYLFIKLSSPDGQAIVRKKYFIVNFFYLNTHKTFITHLHLKQYMNTREIHKIQFISTRLIKKKFILKYATSLLR